MAQMHSQFVTGEDEQTAVSVTHENGTWGVTLVAMRKLYGQWTVVYRTTFGAYVDEQGAYELYAKMSNAYEYRGLPEVRT